MYIVFFTGKSMGERFDDMLEMANYIKSCFNENPHGTIKIQMYL